MYIALGQLYWRMLGSDFPPPWLLSLALAPFTAMIFVRVLKNIQLQVPVRVRELDVSRQMWLTALVVAAISLTFSGVDWVRDQLFDRLAATDDIKNLYVIGTVGLSASWVVKAIIIAASYGSFAVIVERGRIVISAVFELARGNLLRFFRACTVTWRSFQRI